MTILDLTMQRCYWMVIAHDGAMPCKCGEHPYTDGEPCPKCWAWMRVEELEHKMKQTKHGAEMLAKPEPKWLARCRKAARRRIMKLVALWKDEG